MSRQKGFLAEQKAKEYLQALGFEIIQQNFYCRFGEIDIIALKDDILHFIEVKSSQNNNPIYAITPKKLAKIQKTLQFFIMQNHCTNAYCISAICIQNDKIDFLENIIL